MGRITAGRVHGTLISMGLIEHRPGVATFVLKQAPKSAGAARGGGELMAAAQEVVAAVDGWHPRARALAEAVGRLREALR